MTGTVYRTRRWRHIRRAIHATRYRNLCGFGWRVGVVPHAWALPAAVVRDYASNCLMIYFLCVAVRIWHDDRR